MAIKTPEYKRRLKIYEAFVESDDIWQTFNDYITKPRDSEDINTYEKFIFSDQDICNLFYSTIHVSIHDTTIDTYKTFVDTHPHVKQQFSIFVLKPKEITIDTYARFVLSNPEINEKCNQFVFKNYKEDYIDHPIYPEDSEDLDNNIFVQMFDSVPKFITDILALIEIDFFIQQHRTMNDYEVKPTPECNFDNEYGRYDGDAVRFKYADVINIREYNTKSAAIRNNSEREKHGDFLTNTHIHGLNHTNFNTTIIHLYHGLPFKY